MVKQAKGYSKEEKQVYLEAAARFRLPYWDIIMPRNDEQVEPPPGKTRIDPTAIWGCPEILKVEEVFVKLPENHPDKIQGSIWNKIKNPLASFAFPTGQEYKSHPERKKLHLDSGSVPLFLFLRGGLNFLRVGLIKSKLLGFQLQIATMRLTVMPSIS